MRKVLQYDRHFDEQFYSCELGVAKPDGAYFTAILDRLALSPDRVLFIDDNAKNVEAARAVGLTAWVYTANQDSSNCTPCWRNKRPTELIMQKSGSTRRAQPQYPHDQLG